MGELNHAVDLFLQRVAQSGGRTALRYKENGTWRACTWNDWERAAREIAAGLLQAGVTLGDRVCLLANTRHEWMFADLGILMAGAVTVPIYQSNTPEQCEYIITDSGAKVVIAEDPYQLEKLLHPEFRPRLKGVVKVVLMADTAQLEKPDHRGRTTIKLDDVLPAGHADRGWVSLLGDLRAEGRTWLARHPAALEASWEKITPESIFTIVYTSGTTGPPKGVVLSHRNMVFECGAVSALLDITEEDEQLLFLPLAHIFARILEWTSVACGNSTAFAESISKLIENMKEIRPTFMGSVPRVYEKAYTKMQAGFEEKRKKAVTRTLIDWALGVGKKSSGELQAGREPAGALALQRSVADLLIFSKIKETFGGRLRFFISGGAPLSREIAEFFHAAGVLVLEGYGLTETTAATHVNRPTQFKFGTVGPAVPGVEVKIAPDGEILVRGENVMREYYRKPEATHEAIDPDGWFHTGDIGVIEEGGFLRITDRKKDIIVTAGGKNVAPQNIENLLKASCPLLSQAMVHGDKRSFLSALLTLSEESLVPWARERGLAYQSVADLSQKPEIKSAIQEAVDRVNGQLASYETIKKFAILPRDFTQEAGELTPTLKVKRRFCSEKYKGILDGFYAGA